MATFGTLQRYRDTPIPAHTSAIETKRGYREIPIVFGGVANAEPLIDVRSLGVNGENFYAQTRNPPYYEAIPGAITQILVRRGVAERLCGVNAILAEANLELSLFDAWRPQAVQIYFHDHWLPAELRRRKPNISDAELAAEVQNYWAAPSAGVDAPSPHSTGGAVDLTIRWQNGDPLWMGSLFDDASPLAHTDRFEKEADDAAFSFSNEEARANRRLLYWLMVDAGFASNPSEWWHFSFGDQMWAKLRNEPEALYAGTEAQT